MAKTKKNYIKADDALDAGLDLEVAPYDPKEVKADSEGRYVGQNGLTYDDLNMVGTGQYINATNWEKMPDGYSIVENPYMAASPEQLAQRLQGSQVSTNRNDMELLGDEAYNSILKYQKDWADANARGDQAAMDAAHAAAEAVRAKYGYSGGADGSEHLGLMAYTGNSTGKKPSGGSGGSYYSGSSTLPGYVSTVQKPQPFDFEAAPEYLSKYQDRIDALADAILNREAFSYDPETDPTYQQYAASYTRDGKRAMQDTLAQTSARTGGLASSYAQGAAQQSYNNYMAALADKIPELKQLAYAMYMDDLNQDRADLSMLQGLEQTDYGRFMDELGQWNTDRGFAYGQYRDDVADSQWQENFNYGMYRDNVADSQWQTQFDYGVHRDNVADQQWQQQFDYGVSRDQVADSQWAQQFAYQQQQDALAQQNWQTQWDYQVQQDALARQDALNKLTAGSGGGSSGGYGSGGALSTIYGMGNEAEVYDYLVSQGMSKAEVENYMNYWKQNSNDQAYDAYLNGPQGNESDGSYKFIDDELKNMLREGYDPGEVMQRLEVAYDRDLLTREEYLQLKKKYQD